MLNRTLSVLRGHRITLSGGVFHPPRATLYAPRFQYLSGMFPRRCLSNINDPWHLLGISRNTNEDEVKKAYRKMALRYHPDRPDGDEEKFKEISAAYDQITKFNASNPSSESRSRSSRDSSDSNIFTHGADPFSRQEADRIFESIFGKEFTRMTRDFEKAMHKNNSHGNFSAFGNVNLADAFTQKDSFDKKDLDNMFSNFAEDIFKSDFNGRTSTGRYGGRSSTETNMSVIVEDGRKVKVTTTKVVKRGQVVSESTTREDLGPAPPDGSFTSYSSTEKSFSSSDSGNKRTRSWASSSSSGRTSSGEHEAKGSRVDQSSSQKPTGGGSQRQDPFSGQVPPGGGNPGRSGMSRSEQRGIHNLVIRIFFMILRYIFPQFRKVFSQFRNILKK